MTPTWTRRLVVLGLLAASVGLFFVRRLLPVPLLVALSQPLLPAMIYFALALAAHIVDPRSQGPTDTLIPRGLPLYHLVTGLSPFLGMTGGAVFVFGSISALHRVHGDLLLSSAIGHGERWAVTIALVVLLYCTIAPVAIRCWLGTRRERTAPVEGGDPPPAERRRLEEQRQDEARPVH